MIQAFPDLTGYAPKAEAWHAIDEDTYDGAEDSKNRNHVGYGATEAEAIADLERLLDEITRADDPEEQAEHERKIAALDLPEREP